MKATQLTRDQVRTYGPLVFTERGQKYRITASVRFDDSCRNGHNTFSITGTIYRHYEGRWVEHSGGCLHEDIGKHFAELAPLIKWHLCSTDGPMHYVANTMYHAKEHGPTHAWVYYRGPSDPLNFMGEKEILLGYFKTADAVKAECHPNYRLEWDQKTTKVAALQHARATAIWPDATIEQLRDELALQDRLHALLADFRKAIESLGFTW